MIIITSKGSFKKTQEYLNTLNKLDHLNLMHHYGELGVRALANNTPKDTGETANSWDYEVEKIDGRYSIIWSNSNVNNGVQIAVLIQYGHATRDGSWVEGEDYINPSIKPIFDKIRADLWKKVTNG